MAGRRGTIYGAPGNFFRAVAVPKIISSLLDFSGQGKKCGTRHSNNRYSAPKPGSGMRGDGPCKERTAECQGEGSDVSRGAAWGPLLPGAVRAGEKLWDGAMGGRANKKTPTGGPGPCTLSPVALTPDFSQGRRRKEAAGPDQQKKKNRGFFNLSQTFARVVSGGGPTRTTGGGGPGTGRPPWQDWGGPPRGPPPTRGVRRKGPGPQNKRAPMPFAPIGDRVTAQASVGPSAKTSFVREVCRKKEVAVNSKAVGGGYLNFRAGHGRHSPGRVKYEEKDTSVLPRGVFFPGKKKQRPGCTQRPIIRRLVRSPEALSIAVLFRDQRARGGAGRPPKPGKKGGRKTNGGTPRHRAQRWQNHAAKKTKHMIGGNMERFGEKNSTFSRPAWGMAGRRGSWGRRKAGGAHRGPLFDGEGGEPQTDRVPQWGMVFGGAGDFTSATPAVVTTRRGAPIFFFFALGGAAGRFLFFVH